MIDLQNLPSPFPEVPNVRWYHGGRLGLRPGDILLPSAQTGLLRHAKEHHERVFVTYTPYIASMYCGAVEGSAIYQVQPLGTDIIPDTETSRFQFRCPCARVLSVVATDVPAGMTEDWVGTRMERSWQTFHSGLLESLERATAQGRRDDAAAITRLLRRIELAEEKGLEPLSA